MRYAPACARRVYAVLPLAIKGNGQLIAIRSKSLILLLDGASPLCGPRNVSLST